MGVREESPQSPFRRSTLETEQTPAQTFFRRKRRMRTKWVSGQVVFGDGVRPASVSFDGESGTIVSVEQVDANQVDERLLFPGFIDIHVHAREYPRSLEGDSQARERWEMSCRKETFSSAGEAALNGGVTLFGAMPNDPNPPSDKES